MPAIANLVINDGAPTPVAHTFTPASLSGVLAIWKERLSSGVAKFFPYITGQLKEPAGGSTVYRAKYSIVVPTTVIGSNGATTEDYRNLANLEFVFSERSTEQERKNVRLYVRNMMDNASIITMIDKLEPAY